MTDEEYRKVWIEAEYLVAGWWTIPDTIDKVGKELFKAIKDAGWEDITQKGGDVKCRQTDVHPVEEATVQPQFVLV